MYTGIDDWCYLDNKEIKSITRNLKTTLKTYLIKGKRDLY